MEKVKHVYTLKRDQEDNRDYKFMKKVLKAPVPVPAVIDLSSKTPKVFNQYDLGSCTANSTTRATMYARGENDIELSRLFQYWKTREIEGTIGEDAGASNRDAAKSANKNGICEEKYMPYDTKKFAVTPSAEASENALSHKAVSYYGLDSIDEVFQALATGHPVVIGMTVFESFEGDKTAKSGVMTLPTNGEEELGGHSVLIEGKNDSFKLKKLNIFQKFINKILKKPVYTGGGYFKIANSWGEEWGDKGYFYMPYEFFNKYTFDYWCIL